MLKPPLFCFKTPTQWREIMKMNLFISFLSALCFGQQSIAGDLVTQERLQPVVENLLSAPQIVQAGGVSDGGSDRVASAVFIQFWGYGYQGVDAPGLNYANDIIKDAEILNLVKDQYQQAIGYFGQTQLCVQFQGEPHSGALFARGFIKQMSRQVLADQYYYGLVVPRTHVYLGKNCSQLSLATKQDLNAYLK